MTTAAGETVRPLLPTLGALAGLRGRRNKLPGLATLQTGRPACTIHQQQQRNATPTRRLCRLPLHALTSPLCRVERNRRGVATAHITSPESRSRPPHILGPALFVILLSNPATNQPSAPSLRPRSAPPSRTIFYLSSGPLGCPLPRHERHCRIPTPALDERLSTEGCQRHCPQSSRRLPGAQYCSQDCG